MNNEGDDDNNTSASNKIKNKREKKQTFKDDLNKEVDDKVDNNNCTSVIKHYHMLGQYVLGDMKVAGDIVKKNIGQLC